MNQPNPLFKPILDKLPPALHALVIPELEKWDQGVQARFEEIKQEYAPYEAFKPFVENNINADYAWQSVVFADEMQRDPKGVVQKIHEAFSDRLADVVVMDKAEYDKALSEAAPASNDDGGDLFENESGKVDFTKIPEFAQMQQALQQLQAEKDAEREREQQNQELEEFENELNDLEKETTEAGKPFNRTVVTAFMSQGLSGEDAVKQLHILLGQDAEVDENANNNPPSGDAPVTMGNGGNVGSGSGDEGIDWANMPSGEFNENVAKILEAQLGPNS